jgi:hypothetical protein
MKRRGVELRIILDGEDDLPRMTDPALLLEVSGFSEEMSETAALSRLSRSGRCNLLS